MAAKTFVFVFCDGHASTFPVRDAPWSGAPEWLISCTVGMLRQYPGPTSAFLREGYACRAMGDDEQEGAIVYVERPVALYNQERASRVRDLERATRRLEEMPEAP